MRVLTWCLGMMVMEAWRSVLSELGHQAPLVWYGWFIFWIVLGLGGGVAHAVRWAIGMYKAGVPAPLPGTHASAPAVIRKEHT